MIITADRDHNFERSSIIFR